MDQQEYSPEEQKKKKQKVIPLRSKDISPRVVCDAVSEAIDKGNVDAVYVIGLKDGITTCWASGDLNQIGLALVALQNLVSRYINDEIQDER